MLSIGSMNGVLAAAYLEQLSKEKGMEVSKTSSNTTQRSTSFSEVLQNEKARQVNQENYNRLKEAAGGRVVSRNTNHQSCGSQSTLLQLQRILMNQAFLSTYGMNMYSGYGSFF